LPHRRHFPEILARPWTVIRRGVHYERDLKDVRPVPSARISSNCVGRPGLLEPGDLGVFHKGCAWSSSNVAEGLGVGF
jgi:hypothetical protein